MCTPTTICTLVSKTFLVKPVIHTSDICVHHFLKESMVELRFKVTTLVKSFCYLSPGGGRVIVKIFLDHCLLTQGWTGVLPLDSTSGGLWDAKPLTKEIPVLHPLQNTP